MPAPTRPSPMRSWSSSRPRRKVFIEMAEEEHEHRRRLTEPIPAEIRRFHPADPPRATSPASSSTSRSGSCSIWASIRCASAPRCMELENYALLPPGRRTQRAIPAIRKLLTIWPRPRRSIDRLPTGSGLKHLTPDARTPRRRGAAPAVPAAGHPAGARRADGRLGLDAGAALRRGLRHPRHLADLPGRHAASLGAGISMGLAEGLSDDGKLTGRGHPLIRGLASGMMTAVGGLGHALPYLIPRFLDGDRHRHDHRLHRAVGDLLDPLPIYGHAVPARRVPGGGWRRAGLPHRDLDRQRIDFVMLMESSSAALVTEEPRRLP